MRLTFLGKSTQGGGSPTLYATDQDTYVIQGWKVAGEPANLVEIPESLLAYLAPGTERVMCRGRPTAKGKVGVRLLQGSEFDELFRTFESSAFHLEVEDAYHTPDESEPFQKFLSGTPDDFAWHKPWLDLVHETTATGRRVERIRVVSVPHVDYTRWGLTVAPLNIEAGEDIRWLPRDLLDGTDITTDDFWLIDRTRVVFTVFRADGTFSGGAETVDPVIVKRCNGVRDALWSIAVPHADYVNR